MIFSNQSALIDAINRIINLQYGHLMNVKSSTLIEMKAIWKGNSICFVFVMNCDFNNPDILKEISFSSVNRILDWIDLTDFYDVTLEIVTPSTHEIVGYFDLLGNILERNGIYSPIRGEIFLMNKAIRCLSHLGCGKDKIKKFKTLRQFTVRSEPDEVEIVNNSKKKFFNFVPWILKKVVPLHHV